MSIQLTEYIQYYLTDFEWLIILACLWKPLGPKYFLSRYSYSETQELLQTVRSLHSLDIEIYPLERRHYYRWKEVLGTSREGTGINVSCKDVAKLEKWVLDYIEHYQQGKIIGRGTPALGYKKSMQATLNLLHTYEENNGTSAYIRREIDDGSGNIIRANSRSRLLEDLFILCREDFISFSDIEYAYGNLSTDNAATDIDTLKAHSAIVLSLTALFNRDVNSMQEKLLPEIAELKANVPIQVQTQTDLPHKTSNNDLPNEEEDNPDAYLGLRIVDNKQIYFGDILLTFKKNTKELKLIKYLIRRQDRPSYRDNIIDDVLKYKNAAKQTPKYPLKQMFGPSTKGPKKGFNRRKRDRFRKLVQEVNKKLSGVNLIIDTSEKRCVKIKTVEK